MKTRQFKIIAVLSVFIACVGCDSGKNSVDNSSVRTEALNLSITLADFLPHIGQYSELRVISSDNQLQSLIVLDPIDATEVNLKLSKGLPPGQHRLDVFADINNNRRYDSLPFDHSWRFDIPESGNLSISHDSPFTDLRDPPLLLAAGRLSIDFSGFGSLIGRLLEIHVIDVVSGQTVVVYRQPLIPDSSFQVDVDGVIGDGLAYRVDYYVDMNFNFDYDPPPTDFAWRRIAQANSSGLALDIQFDSLFIDIELP